MSYDTSRRTMNSVEELQAKTMTESQGGVFEETALKDGTDSSEPPQNNQVYSYFFQSEVII